MIERLFQGLTALGPEWVMYLLILLSIVSVAIILERWLKIRKQEKGGSALWAEHVDNWVKNGLNQDWSKSASEISLRFPCLESEVLRVLSKTDTRTTDGTMVADSYISHKKLELEKFTSFLGTVGANAPFIGLLGTVLGIIRAFHGLAGNLEAGSQSISQGIAEALVATAVGLFVAIPAVIAYNFFQRRINTIISRAQSISQLILSNKSNKA